MIKLAPDYTNNICNHYYEVKADVHGEFRGYASVFNVRDSYGDIIKPHAFATSLRQHPHIPLLWQHEPKEPIGVVESLVEDNIGLMIQGRLLLELARAQEAYNLLRNKVLSGLSIGFRITQSYQQRHPQPSRIITGIDLIEISIVTFPANRYANILQLKTTKNQLFS